MSDLFGPGIGALLAIVISSFTIKLFTLSEYESDTTTEHGDYHVHITRMAAWHPYIKVKIQDKTRNRNYSRTLRKKDLIQQYDVENIDEVVREIVQLYENTICKKLLQKNK